MRRQLVQLSGVIGGRGVASNLFTLPAELAVLCDLENSPRKSAIITNE
jgi:hypothetical protein